MVTINSRAFGWERKAYVAQESTYGTPVMPLASYSVPVLEFSITPTQERLGREDSSGIRSFQNNRFSGRKSADWRILKYIIPSGTAGTAPDDDVLLQAALGDKTTQTATIQYTPDDDDLPSLSMFRHVQHFMQGCYGAACNQLVISLSGTDFSTLEYSGPAKDFVWAGTTTIAATANNAATNVKVTDGDFFSTNISVRFGSGSTWYSNGATGYKILTVSGNTLSITPGLETTLATGITVSPFPPTFSSTGDALHGAVSGSFTTNSTTVTILSATVTINNNLQLRADEFGQTTPTAIVLDRRREVTFTLELYLTRANFYLFGEGASFTAQNIVLASGSTAGKKFRVLLPQGEFEVPAINDPGAEGETTLSVSGSALSTSSGQDDVTLEYY